MDNNINSNKFGRAIWFLHLKKKRVDRQSYYQMLK